VSIASIIQQITLKPLTPIATEYEHRLNLLKVSAVIFDVYGTLLISGSGEIGVLSESMNLEIFNQIVQKFGGKSYAAHRLEELIRADHEKSAFKCPEVDILELWKLIEQESGMKPGSATEAAIEYECLVNPVWEMPGLKTTLEYCSRFSMGIVSNAQAFTPFLLEKFLGNNLAQAGFDTNLLSWSYAQKQSKPCTAIFRPVLHGLQALGIEPGSAVYIGNDMRNDISTAQAVGMQTVLFAGDKRSLRLREAEFPSLRPDAVITHLSQLATILQME
jgi:putative hydrolase of the HAD superfamily